MAVLRGEAKHSGPSPYRPAATPSLPIWIPRPSLNFPQAPGPLPTLTGNLQVLRLPGSTVSLFLLSPEMAAAWALTLTL